MKIGCVVFDIDDTLYLERDYIRSGFVAVSRWLSAQRKVIGFFELAWKMFEIGWRGNVFDRTLECLQVPYDRELIRQLVKVYRNHRPEIVMLEDASALLVRLHGYLPLAVVSDGPMLSQRAKVEALELRTWVDPILFTDELGLDAAKPCPRAFLAVEKIVGVRGARCVYIADNPKKDFRGPKVLGWRTIRIRRAAGIYSSEKDCGDVDLTVETLDGLINWIEKPI